MNPKIIEVKLLSIDEETDTLRFFFDTETQDVNLNSSDCQNDLKEVFIRMISQLINNDLQLELSIEEGFDKGLYIEVCREYIKDLNRELISVKKMLSEELDIS